MTSFHIQAKLEPSLRHILRQHPQKFPHSLAAMAQWGDEAARQWVKLAQSKGRSFGQQGWWLRNYLGANAKNISWRFAEGLAVRVFHDNKGSKYDFGRVIEQGRPPYELKRALYTSRKVRYNKQGQPYLIIPFPESSGAPDIYAKKRGERREPAKDGSPVLRNIYSYHRQAQGSLVAFEQVDRLGRPHRSLLRWKTMSARSAGWRYPAVPGFRYSQAVRDAILSGRARMAGLSFQQSVAQALARDLASKKS